MFIYMCDGIAIGNGVSRKNTYGDDDDDVTVIGIEVNCK